VPAPYASKLEAALDHAARGFAVFPLRTNAKIPRFEGWQAAATSDPAQIRQWWSQWPRANIGILTTRLLVVDIDPRNGGDASAEALHKATPLPKTLCSKTQGGGARMISRSTGRQANVSSSKTSNLVELPDLARFRFSPEADTELREIEAFKEREIARPNASNFIRQWLDKLPNEFGRVALAFHQIECCTSDCSTVFEDPAPELISVDTARRARRYLTEFIFSHTQAFALQAPQSSTSGDNAVWIAGFILAGERTTINARDVYRSYHAIRREDISRVMGDLELLDWVRPIKFDARSVATGWAVNPAVHDARFAEIAEAERLRRADVRQRAAQGRLPEIQHAPAIGQG
jgi:hypothetical protein